MRLLVKSEKIFWSLTFAFSCLYSFQNYAEIPAKNSLNLDTALQLAYDWSFDLKSSQIEICMREAETWQVGRIPNPELSIEFDDFGRIKHGDSTEVTYAISQVLELGGKRRARQSVARSLEDIEYWNFQLEKLELRKKITHAFINAYKAQEKLKIAIEQKKIAEKTLACTACLKDNGKYTIIQQKKAEIANSSSQLSLNKAQEEFHHTKHELAIFWGCESPDFDEVFFPFFDALSPPSLDNLCVCLANNPELMKKRVEISSADENIKLERSQRIPDMEVSFGASTELHGGDTSLLFELSMPIPLFDRNQGNICKAKLFKLQTEYAFCNAEMDLKNELSEIYCDWMEAFNEVQMLKNTILPAASESLQITTEGFNEGKLTYLETLEAEKTVYEIKEQYIDALANYHHQKVDAERLVGSYED